MPAAITYIQNRSKAAALLQQSKVTNIERQDGSCLGELNSQRFPRFFELDLHPEFSFSLAGRRCTHGQMVVWPIRRPRSFISSSPSPIREGKSQNRKYQRTAQRLMVGSKCRHFEKRRPGFTHAHSLPDLIAGFAIQPWRKPHPAGIQPDRGGLRKRIIAD
jgi:hypothetical protein